MFRPVRMLGFSAIQCGLLLYLGLATSSLGADENKDQTEPAPADAQSSPVSPMLEQGATAAPYSIRLRITGFLARQHARDGDQWRSLVEFYSMLNVDDPAWTDDEQGDAMRIGRDIEVAQMMTEAGFCDHAIRVLHTSFILAFVNQDPQSVLVERQIQATVELARLKGLAVPVLDLSFLNDVAAVRVASDLVTEQIEKAASGPATAPEQSGPALTADSVDSLQSSPTTPPREFPRGKIEPIPVPNSPAPSLEDSPTGAVDEPEVSESKERASRFNRFIPSRWRQKKEITTAANVHHEAPPMPPTTSPNVAPTYCQQCNGLHGHGQGTVVVRYNPRTGITHSHVPYRAEPSPMPSPFQTDFSRLHAASPACSEPHGSHGATANRTTALASNSSPANQPSASDRIGLSGLRETAGPALKSPSPPAKSAPGDELPASLNAREPMAAQDSRPSASPTTNAPATEQVGQMSAVSATAPAQVAVAGNVPNPGIFALQGRSTTLAALLRRTGESTTASGKQTRILRAVEVRSGESGEPVRDLYCQRIDGLQAHTGAMDLPVYGQEVVIVDGAGEKPIYVAVMPHFVLQVPFDAKCPVTTNQVVDAVRGHWPNLKDESIGVLRYEQWGPAAKLADPISNRLADSTLFQGDVLYIDGSSLDQSQVLSAAESIAGLAGARLRRHESTAAPLNDN